MLKIHTFCLDLDMKLLAELSRIDRFDAGWAAIEKREAISLMNLRSIATVRSVGASTRIEGSRMTDDEVAVLLEKLSMTALEERDQQEVAGYFEALDTIIAHYDAIDITESQIRSLHNLMMKHGEKDAWHRGNYKLVSNAVEARLPDGSTQIVFRTADPGLPTEEAMRRLMDWYQRDSETLPLVKAALFVYDLLSIHPFQDGNGRLSRLLGTLLLLKEGYSWIQYVSFEHEIESRKSEYYQALMETQRNRPGENVTRWLQFFLDCLCRIQDQLLLKLEAGKPQVDLAVREKRIISFLVHHPGSRSGEIAKKLDIALPTLKKDLKNLSGRGVLTKEGQGRATCYFVVEE